MRFTRRELSGTARNHETAQRWMPICPKFAYMFRTSLAFLEVFIGEATKTDTAIIVLFVLIGCASS